MKSSFEYIRAMNSSYAAQMQMKAKWKKHRKRVQGMRPSVDTSIPKTLVEERERKRLRKKSKEKEERIERDNFLLVNRMIKIFESKGEYDPHRLVADYERMQSRLSAPTRSKEAERIEHDNKILLSHLENVHGFLDFKNQKAPKPPSFRDRLRQQKASPAVRRRVRSKAKEVREAESVRMEEEESVREESKEEEPREEEEEGASVLNRIASTEAFKRMLKQEVRRRKAVTRNIYSQSLAKRPARKTKSPGKEESPHKRHVHPHPPSLTRQALVQCHPNRRTGGRGHCQPLDQAKSEGEEGSIEIKPMGQESLFFFPHPQANDNEANQTQSQQKSQHEEQGEEEDYEQDYEEDYEQDEDHTSVQRVMEGFEEALERSFGSLSNSSSLSGTYPIQEGMSEGSAQRQQLSSSSSTEIEDEQDEEKAFVVVNPHTLLKKTLSSDSIEEDFEQTRPTVSYGGRRNKE